MEKYPTLFGCATGGDGSIIVIGVPYDRGTDSGHAGCAAAPSLLRRLSSPEHFRVKNGELYDLAKRETIFRGHVVSDLGNIRFRATHHTDDEYLEFVAQAVAAVARKGKKPLVLGGDHLVTLAVLRGLSQAGRAFQVLQFDAHHDYDVIGTGERPTHASFMSFVAAEGLAKQVIQVGVRGLAWGAPPAPNGITMATVTALKEVLMRDVDVYVTVDTDAFDPAVAPAVSYPVPEGLPFAALGAALEQLRLAGLNVIGADWTEYNPTFDTANNITGRVILRGLSQLIQSLADARG